MLCVGLPASLLNAQTHHRESLLLMGSAFELTVVADTREQAERATDAGIEEIRRIEARISSWQDSSETSAVNRAAGLHPVVVSSELLQLVHRARKVSGLTGGAFDLSFAGAGKLYQFDRGEHTLPDDTALAAAFRTVNWRQIELDLTHSTIYLKIPGMRIGFGAIGKGYAANRARAVMRNMDGVRGGLVNAGGDLLAWGQSNRPEGWRVQILDPKNRSRALGWLSIRDGAVVTSGDYEKYFTHRGKRYAHILDPRTGLPAEGLTSVTILCPDAELADALATSVFVLGREEGLALINQLDQIECILVDDTGQLHTSENLKLNFYE